MNKHDRQKKSDAVLRFKRRRPRVRFPGLVNLYCILYIDFMALHRQEILVLSVIAFFVFGQK